MMRHTGKSVGPALAGAAMVLGLMGSVHSQDYPRKPVKIISTGPGGSSDNLARVFANELKDVWPQGVIVENRNGMGGAVPTMTVEKAAPDGYTLLINTSAFIVSAETAKNPLYDPINGFSPVAMVGKGPLLLVARKDLPSNSLSQLLAFARQNPGALTFASTGLGGITHLSAELFFQEAKVSARHIPFTNGSQATQNVAGGHVDVYLGSLSLSLPLARSGTLKPLAITSPKRSRFAPDIPTAAEGGLPADFGLELWWGIFAPAKTPQPAVSEANLQINRLLDRPAVKGLLDKEGVDPSPMSPEQFAKFLRQEQARWRKVVIDSKFEKE